jgi:hypothetical protein
MNMSSVRFVRDRSRGAAGERAQRREMRKYPKNFLLPFLIVCLTSALSLAVSRGPVGQKLDALSKIQGRFSFAVVGDTRSGGDDYRRLIDRMMEYKPDFIVNAGDMINSPRKVLWEDFWKQSKPITVPYFLVVGNHDVGDEKTEKLYKEEVDLPGNELYYSFTAGDSLFVVLDSNIPSEDRKISGEQYKWLEQVLATCGKRHIFVFIHHPLYPEKGLGLHYGGSLDKHPKERDRLQALFVKCKVTAVFVGHEHLYLRKSIEGILEIITGGGGAMLYARQEAGGFYHFILVTVNGGEVKGEVIDINGKVKDTFGL